MNVYEAWRAQARATVQWTLMTVWRLGELREAGQSSCVGDCGGALVQSRSMMLNVFAPRPPPRSRLPYICDGSHRTAEHCCRGISGRACVERFCDLLPPPPPGLMAGS